MPSYLTLTQSWWPVFPDSNFLFMVFMPHSWSISTEWGFYFLFPLIAIFASRLKTLSWMVVVALCVWLASVIFFLAYRYVVLANFELAQAGLFMKWLTYFSPVGRLCEFIFGCLIGACIRVSNMENFIGPHAQWLAVFSVIGLVLVGCFASREISVIETSTLGYLAPSLLQAPFVALLIAASASCKHLFGGAFVSPLMLLVGECSYSLYLFHPLFTTHFANAVVNLGAHLWFIEPILRAIIMVVCSVMVAYGGYFLIEKPCRARVRKMLAAGAF